MENLHELLVKLLRPASFVVWGLFLLVAASVISNNASVDSSFFVRHLFALSLISWVAGLVLVIRVRLRGQRRDRTMFG